MHVDAIERGPVVVAGAAHQQFDLVLWATGPAPLPWLARSGLALDERGFVRVDRALRSVSHPHVLAVGDCAALDEPKSGVHAVRHGIAARGGWSAQGRWVWWWKNAIDRRWMRRLNATRINSYGR